VPAHTRQMTLTRTKERHALREQSINFSMQPAEAACEITFEALAQLGRTRGLTEPTDIFVTGRDAIERVASDKYNRTSRRPYEIVTITIDDLGP
jgi:hypothetical protein